MAVINVGKTDKIIRVILGLTIIAGGVLFQSWWGLVGAVSLVTAAMGWCPLYIVAGLNTNK